MQKNTIVRYSILAGLWAVLLIPFFVANTMFFPFITGKNFAFRIIVEIIFVLWVYLAFADAKYRPKKSWIIWTVSVFVLVMAIADAHGVNAFKSFWSNYERMDGWVTLIHLLMYLVVFASVMKTEKIWMWFFRSSAALSVIMSFMAMSEYATTHTRVNGPLGNADYIAVYFIFAFFIPLILLYKDVIAKGADSFGKLFSNWLTYIYGIVAALSFYGLWLSATRGAILGLLGGLIITALIIAIFEKQNKLLRQASIGTLACIAFIVLGFLAIKNTQFVKNDATLQRFAEISWGDIQGQGQARQLIWPMAIKGFEEKPILGWGQEGFNYVFNKYYNPQLYNQEQWFDRAHDEPLDILVAGGILGEIAYLSIFAAILYLLWKKRNAIGIANTALLVGVLAAYFGQNLFVFDDLISYIYFFIILAYIYSIDAENIGAKVTDIKTAEKPAKKFSDDIVNYVVLPILLIVLGISLYYVNIVPISANFELIDAMQTAQTDPAGSLQHFKNVFAYNAFGSPEAREQLSSITPNIAQSSIDTSIKQDFANLTYSEMQTQVAATPNDARYQLFAGVFLDNMGQYSLATQYLAAANQLSPTKQTIAFELIKNYEFLGNNDQAFALAKQAYESDTDYSDAESYYIGAALLDSQSQVVTQLLGANATTSDPIIIRAFLIKASNQLQKGDKNGAIQTINAAIQMAPVFKDQGTQVISGIEKGTY